MIIKFDPALEYRSFYDPELSVLSMLSTHTGDQGWAIGSPPACGFVVDADRVFIDLEIHTDRDALKRAIPARASVRLASAFRVEVPSDFIAHWVAGDEGERGWIVLDEEIIKDHLLFQLGRSDVYLAVSYDCRLLGIYMARVVRDPGGEHLSAWLESLSGVGQ